MIASQNKHLVLVQDLVGKKEANCLDALFAPIDVVPKEEIARLRRQTSILEHPEQIRELSMDIAADPHGRIDFDQHVLLQEDSLDQTNDAEDLELLQLGRLPWLLVP